MICLKHSSICPFFTWLVQQAIVHFLQVLRDDKGQVSVSRFVLDVFYTHSYVLAEFILKNSRPLRILSYCCFCNNIFGLLRARIEHSNPDGTIGRDDIKGGLDNNGSGGGEDVVEVGEVEPAVACSTLARF